MKKICCSYGLKIFPVRIINSFLILEAGLLGNSSYFVGESLK